MPVTEIERDVKDLLYYHLYEPWGVAQESDWLSGDDGGEFIVMRDDNGELLGTTRIMPPDRDTSGHPVPLISAGERRLRQVVVAPGQRGRGIGSALMCTAEDRLRELGVTRVGVAARCEAYDFYHKCGYTKVGPEYISPLTNIPHTHMSKELVRQ